MFLKRIVLLVFIVLVSCTVTHRRYMPGYSVDWKKKEQNKMVPNIASKDNKTRLMAITDNTPPKGPIINISKKKFSNITSVPKNQNVHVSKNQFFAKNVRNMIEQVRFRQPASLSRYGDTLNHQKNTGVSPTLHPSVSVLFGTLSLLTGFLALASSSIIGYLRFFHTPGWGVFYILSFLGALVFTIITLIKVFKILKSKNLSALYIVGCVTGIVLCLIGIVLSILSLLYLLKLGLI